MRLRVVVALLFTVSLMPGCTTQSDLIGVSGRIVDDTVAIGAPPLAVPSPSSQGGAAPAQRSSSGTVASLVGLGSAVRVSSVTVGVGQRVRIGDVVARLDREALDAAIDSARAARRSAAAQISVIDTRLDDVAGARSTISDSRENVRDTIAELEDTRAELVAQLSSARAQRAEIDAILDSLPSGGGTPPGSVVPSDTALPPGAPLPDPAQLAAALRQLDAGVAKLEAAIAKIDAGLVRARAGRAQLEDASADAEDARTTLTGVRRVARAALSGRTVAVSLATVQRDLAVLRSPVDGIVVAAVQSGETVSPGAPVVVVRPEASSAVDVWVTPESAALISVDGAAQVRLDSQPGEAHTARVASVGVRALFPPTWIATSEVHLTRAVPVRVTLTDPSAALPPGTPADVEIETDKSR